METYESKTYVIIRLSTRTLEVTVLDRFGTNIHFCGFSDKLVGLNKIGDRWMFSGPKKFFLIKYLSFLPYNIMVKQVFTNMFFKPIYNFLVYIFHYTYKEKYVSACVRLFPLLIFHICLIRYRHYYIYDPNLVKLNTILNKGLINESTKFVCTVPLCIAT